MSDVEKRQGIPACLSLIVKNSLPVVVLVNISERFI